jgi:hypothetical protein
VNLLACVCEDGEDGRTLGVLVELAEVLALLLVDDGEDTGDRLADGVAKWTLAMEWDDSYGSCTEPS